MANTAFATADYPGYTTAQLQDAYNAKSKIIGFGDVAERMQKELDRRFARDNGDMSAMTPGERLRFVKTGKA